MTAPKKKRAPRSGWQMFLLMAAPVIVLAAVGIMAACSALSIFDLGTTVEQSSDEARTSIEKVTGGVLPDDAGDFYFHGVAWTDYSYWMRFSIPAESFPAWLAQASSLCFAPLEASGSRGVAGDGTQQDLSWWTPDAAQTYLSAESCGTNPYYNILVDTTDAHTWIVYLNVFST